MADNAVPISEGEGDHYVKMADSDTVSGHTTKVAYVKQEVLSYKGKDRTTTTGAAEELTIPAGSAKAILAMAPNSQAYIEINGDATTSSPLYYEDPFPIPALDLGAVTKLSAYVVAGNIGAVFFG